MKKLRLWHSGLIILVCTFFNVDKLKAQFVPVVQWASSYNNRFPTGASTQYDAMDWLYDIIQTQDGGYVGVGFTWTGDPTYPTGCDITDLIPGGPHNGCDQNNARTPLVVKKDYAGNTLATFKPGDELGVCTNGSNGYCAQAVVEVSGGYVVCAYLPYMVTCGGTPVKHTKIYVAKLNKADLSVISYAYIDNTDCNDYRAYAMKVVYNTGTLTSPTTENGFIISGLKVTSTYTSAYILRLDNSFSVVHEYDDHLLATPGQFFSVTPIYDNGMGNDGKPICSTCTPGNYIYGGNPGFAAAGQINSGAKMHVVAVDNSLNYAWHTDMVPQYSPSYACAYSNNVTASTVVSSSTLAPGIARPVDPSINCTALTYSYGTISNWHSNPNLINGVAYGIAQIHDRNIVVSGDFDETQQECATPPSGDCYSDEYKSADQVMIKLNGYGGSVGIPTAFIAYNVGGGGDYQARFRERSDYDFVVTGNISNNDVTKGPVLADIGNDAAEAALFKIKSDLSAIVWYKAIKSFASVGDDCSCAFAIDLTSDNGYIIGGNSGTHNNDLIFIKLGGECQNPGSFVTYTPHTSGAYTASTDGAYTPVYSSSGAPILGVWDVTGSLTLTGYTFNFYDTKAQNDFYNPTPYITNLTIEPGATVTLVDCILRGIDCNGHGTWDGIILKGTPGSQVTSGSLILEGSTIEYARTAVAVGTDNTNGGGVLIGEDDGSGNHTYFTNNRIGASFQPTSFAGSNTSSFTSCVFDCNAPLTEYGGQGMEMHVSLNGVSYVSFTGNTFNNSGALSPGYSYCNDQGYGIFALNSDLKVNDPASAAPSYSTASTGCTWTSTYPPNPTNFFNNLDYGIFSTINNTTTRVSSVWLCQFKDDKVGISINGNGYDNPSLGLNYFHYTGALPPSNTICPIGFTSYAGLHIYYCPSYTITNNKLSIDASITNFYEINGIWATSSGTATGPSLIYFNEFRNQSAALASLAYGSPGVWSTGIRIDDPADLGTKHIVINHNGEANPPGITPAANSNLANYYDIYIDDNGFTRTPITATPQLGVDNFFSSGTISELQIYSTNAFTYDHFTFSPYTAPSSVTPILVTVTSLTSSDYLTANPKTNYCMGTDLMPTAPEPINNDLFGGSSTHGEDQSVFASPNTNNPAMKLDIFPNPFNNSADIRYYIPTDFGSASMKIIDGIGKQLKIIQLNTGQHDITINNNGLKPGIYYFNVTTQSNNTLKGKFVVENP